MYLFIVYTFNGTYFGRMGKLTHTVISIIAVMEHQPGSPVAGKAEEQSGSLLLTYFQGDINSMVDAHFSRALENITKPKGDITKSKKPRKLVKSGKT